MKYIIKSSKEIFITYILNYIIIIITGLIYKALGYNNLEFLVNNIIPYILLIFYILAIIYLYKKNYIEEQKLNNRKYFSLILLGISIAAFLNMIIFLLLPSTTKVTIPVYLSLISSGIIGPIYEEILFRYLLYNRLKKKYSIRKSVLITTIIFALIHISSIKIIYAFILGLILNITYEKYHNIIAPILIHKVANTMVIFLYEYNTYILLLSIINLIISIKLNNFKVTNG